MINYIKDNKTWIFSGIGVFIIGFSLTLVKDSLLTGKGSFKDQLPATTNDGSHQQSFGKVLRQDNPFPAKLDNLRIDTPIATLLSLYPDPKGKLEDNLFRIDFDDGPFSFVLCFRNNKEKNSKVDSLSFYFRDKASKAFVLDQALEAYGRNKLIGNIEAGVTEWLDISGYKVSIDDNYYKIYKIEKYETIFDSGDPFPKGYDGIRIGIPISVLKQIYNLSNDNCKDGCCHIDFESGPFNYVLCFYSDEEKIESLYFSIRSSDAKTYLFKQAVDSFGYETVPTETDKEALCWPDVNGYKIILSSGQYQISKNL